MPTTTTTQSSPPRGGLALLAEAFRSKWTGLLVVGGDEAPLRVRLEAGQIVALGPAPTDPPATPMPKPNDSVRLRLERVLSEIGMRRPAPSDGPQPGSSSLRDRLIERLADESQPVRFEEGGEVPADLVGVAVATEPLILEAVRQLQHDDAVRAALGDLDQRLVATTALADERTLTLTEGYLLSRIDGLVSARQVLQLVPGDPTESERSLLGLLLTGRVVCRPAPDTRQTQRLAALPPVAPPPPVAPSTVERAPEAQPPAQAGAALPAEPAAASAAEPKAEPVAAESAAEPRAERVTEDIIAEAIPEDEAEPIAEAASAGPAPAAATADTQPMDAATIERRREILDIFQSLPLKNHFEVLGVEPGCNDAEVRSAYVGLAKRYHPDAHRDRRIEDMHDILEAIFIRVGEAWEVLGEARSRASYETRSGIVRRPRATAREQATLGAAPAPPSPSPEEPAGYVPPEEILFKAQRLLAQARYWDAIQILESSLPRMEPRRQQHRGRLLLARAYSKNPQWLRRAEELLHELMREDPTSADAHYELGMVYKTGGFAARAQGMFKRALELRPGHKEAAAALGIQSEEGSGGGGILKRLFGRGKAS